MIKNRDDSEYHCGAICLAAGFAALFSLEETFHKDLDYFEEFL